MSVHEKSQGYHSGAHDYVAGRPGYPPEATEWLCNVLGAAPAPFSDRENDRLSTWMESSCERQAGHARCAIRPLDCLISSL